MSSTDTCPPSAANRTAVAREGRPPRWTRTPRPPDNALGRAAIGVPGDGLRVSDVVPG